MIHPQQTDDVRLRHPGSPVSIHSSTLPPGANGNENDISPPPPYTTRNPPSPRTLRQTLPTLTEDEEWECGFWGERSSAAHAEKQNTTQLYDLHRDIEDEDWCIYDVWCFCSAVLVCVLACFGAFFILGMVSNKVHFPIGINLPGWNGQRHDNYMEMHFCLETPNRQAPGPQYWRYVAAEKNDRSCATETVSLMVSPAEQWKLRIDDRVLVGEDILAHSHSRGSEQFSQFSGAFHGKSGGDDLAQEGQLV